MYCLYSRFRSSLTGIISVKHFICFGPADGDARRLYRCAFKGISNVFLPEERCSHLSLSKMTGFKLLTQAFHHIHPGSKLVYGTVPVCYYGAAVRV